MNGKELFLGLSYISRKYIDEAETDTVSGNAKASPGKYSSHDSGKHVRLRGHLLIAVIIALMLLLVGCAVIVMRLQHLTIQEEASGIPSETSFNGEPINIISLQGFMGTDSYAAFQEWQDFLSTYDLDKSILYANNDFQTPDAYFSYSCYSQEMIDKIDEICEKYHLQPLGKPWFFDRGEDVFNSVGIESVLSEKARTGLESSSGYCYADGTFDIEGTLELRGKWNELVSYSLRSVQKTSFDGVPRNIGDVDAYDQWNYTMADGTTVLLASREEVGLMIVDKQDSFVTVGIDVFANGGFLGNVPQERAFLEEVCEEFDFTFQTQPVDPAKADALYQAQLEREAGEDHLHVTGGLIGSEYLSSYAGWIDYMVDEMKYKDLKYALVDVDGDGVEELLLQCEHLERYNGDKNSFFGLFTIENSEIKTIVRGSLRGSNYYLCQGGVIEQAYTDSHYYFAMDGTMVESVACYEEVWYHTQGGSIGEGFEQSDAVTEEEVNAIIAGYPRIDIKFKPVSEFDSEESAGYETQGLALLQDD